MKQWLRARWQDWTSNCKGYFVNIFGRLFIKTQPHRRDITMSTDYRRDFSISLLHLLTFDILMPNGLLVSGQMLICYSAHILITQRLTDGVCARVCVRLCLWGWGWGWGWVLGGTIDPLPLPISCTNNMPHASGGLSHPLLWQSLSCPRSRPPGTTGRSAPARCVSPPPLAPWSIRNFPKPKGPFLFAPASHPTQAAQMTVA